jgi:hypothetical protein
MVHLICRHLPLQPRAREVRVCSAETRRESWGCHVIKDQVLDFTCSYRNTARRGQNSRLCNAVYGRSRSFTAIHIVADVQCSPLQDSIQDSIQELHLPAAGLQHTVIHSES